MAHPEGVLVQLLGDPHGLDGALADQQRAKDCQRSLHEARIGEHAADAQMPIAGPHEDKGVDGVFGLDLAAPAALRRPAEQAQRLDAIDLHAHS